MFPDSERSPMKEKTPPPAESSEGPLKGLKEYLGEYQMDSVFVREEGMDDPWTFFLHDGGQVTGRIAANEAYEFQRVGADGSQEKTHKVKVNFLCRESDQGEVLKQMKRAEKVNAEAEGPHFCPRYRHHIKNKSLYPLMNRKEVLFFTLLGGEVLRGVVQGFSRFEIFLRMKRGIPVVILRHAVLDVRDKRNQSYLKKAVEKTGKYW
jgi:sRNA-binding regulator protein Hfq